MSCKLKSLLLVATTIASISPLTSTVAMIHETSRAGEAMVVYASSSELSRGERVDFDGDGFEDIAVGVPLESALAINGTTEPAGGVNALYGTVSGITADENEMFTQGNLGIIGNAELADNFGRAVAVGDFNGDGVSDLAAGIPGEKSGGVDAGAVSVIYGKLDKGLRGEGDQFFSQDTEGIEGEGKDSEAFGNALAAGDFDGDGYSDLAIGVLQDVVGSITAGSVNVLYGSPLGLTVAGNQLFNAESEGIPGGLTESSQFGGALATGDFNGDGFSELAIGVPQGAVGNVRAGHVIIIAGTSSGLRSEASQLFAQGLDGLAGIAQPGDRFGKALAAGDFNGDSFSDIAIGIPGQDLSNIEDAGEVAVIYGTGAGLARTSNQLWNENTRGIAGFAEEEDQFGASLAAGDFTDDGRADLAIGIPFEDLGAKTDAGQVCIIYGSQEGLTDEGSESFTQDTQSIENVAGAEDNFGFALNTGDYNGDRHDDLVIGVPGESSEASSAGAIHILYGRESSITSIGLSVIGSQFWSQGSPGIQSVPVFPEQFGAAVR